MEDKRNIALAIILTGVILFGWPLLAEKFWPTPEPVKTTATAATPSSTAPTISSAQAELGIEAGTTSVDGTAPIAKKSAIRSRDTVLAETPRITVETPKISGSINLVGARIDDIMLTDYREDLDKNSPNIHLFSPSGTKDAYFGRFGWTGTGIALPNDKTLWTASNTALSPQSPVTLSWNNETGQAFEIALVIDENYMITATQKVTNNSENAVAVKSFALLSRSSIPSDQGFWNIHVGPMGVFDDAANYDYDYDDVQEAGTAGISLPNKGAWLGFTDKYWLSAIIPAFGTMTESKFRYGQGGIYQTQMVGKEASVIGAGESKSQLSRMFVGAKETTLLDAYRDDLKIDKFDRAIDWGWFYWFEKPIFYTLTYLYNLLGNFGFAIIGLTFVIRGLMFPIAQKQFASMAQMRAVQPKMKKLQERFKDDKQKQQQEIMKLYKEEKVNPLAGCLPILLQIPVFFALYKVLMLSIEMRHKPFVGWIHDLSAPDPMTPINLFGLIPFDPPSFLAVGILPIIVAITMHLQFKLNPAQMDPIQQQIFSFMPWMIMFVMAPFAAGLQLYWAVNNILTIAQQKWLYSKHPQLKEQIAKDAEDKAKEREEKAKGA